MGLELLPAKLDLGSSETLPYGIKLGIFRVHIIVLLLPEGP